MYRFLPSLTFILYSSLAKKKKKIELSLGAVDFFAPWTHIALYLELISFFSQSSLKSCMCFYTSAFTYYLYILFTFSHSYVLKFRSSRDQLKITSFTLLLVIIQIILLTFSTVTDLRDIIQILVKQFVIDFFVNFCYFWCFFF